MLQLVRTVTGAMKKLNLAHPILVFVTVLHGNAIALSLERHSSMATLSAPHFLTKAGPLLTVSTTCHLPSRGRRQFRRPIRPSVAAAVKEAAASKVGNSIFSDARESTCTRLFSSLATTQGPVNLAPLDFMMATDTIICGGGPAGLLSAIMLARKFPNHKVQVYDRLSEPPSPTDEAVWSDVAKFYLIGLGHRGQSALSEFGVWDEVEAVASAVKGRKDWAPDSDEGVERIFTDRPVDTQVLPRDKLVGVLHQHILKNYAQQVELKYGYEVTPLDFEADDGNSVVVRVSKCEEMERLNPTSVPSKDGGDGDVLCDPTESSLVSANLVIAADGTARTIANSVEDVDRKERASMNPIRRVLAGKPFTVKRYLDDNQRIYKTIPMKIPDDWRPDLNYSARSKSGRVTFDALPADREGNYCGVLLLKKDDPLAAPNSNPEDLRCLLDESLPQFSALVDDETVAVVAKKPPSFLPGFRYVGPRLHHGHRTVLLGDCAHTVKPYFGLGANSAFEDVKCLGQAIDDSNDDLTEAVHSFSKDRAGEAKALVRVSRELDRPGTLGFVTFIFPLILDSLFHGLAPKLFETNMIAILQREGYKFTRAARRKRFDRLAQLVIIGSVFSGMATGGKLAVTALASLLGRRTSTVLAGIAGTVFASILVRKLAFFLVPGMAPADVLGKTKSRITNNDSFITPLGFKDNKQTTTSA